MNCILVHSFKLKKNARLLLGVFFLWINVGYGQNQAKADSLEIIFNSGAFEEEDRLKLLSRLASSHPNPDKSLRYSEELIRRAMALDSLVSLYNGYLQKGNALRLKGDLSEALKSYLKGVQIVSGDKTKSKELGSLNISIAGVYAAMGNEQSTVKYYKDAIELLKLMENRQDSIGYASAIENLGDAYNLEFSKPDSALLLFEESGEIWNKLNLKIGLAYNIGNIGLAYAQLGKSKEAEIKIQQAITMLEELGDYYPICVYLTYMADFSAERNEWERAFEYARRSLNLAKQNSLKEQIGDAYLKLSELYEKRGDIANSLANYKNHITYKDSVQNISAVQQMANVELAQKQRENELLDQKRRTQKIITIGVGFALFLIVLLAIGLFRRNIYIKRTKAIIERERDRSETLLLNILPELTANELKESGEVKASKIDSATVMFTDFKSFTSQAEQVDPEILVYSLGYYFSAFDDIIEKYELEKIKTIGDSYMCAGGVPYPIENHAVNLVAAAFEILDFVAKAKTTDTSLMSFDIRIGINTGPVVAGVVGSKKF
ncbi:adenylate/guanylate cyclase domain-containing protein [uncultured Muriicola sp.]|uniref:adenylate/guanylate cyclase domain-containing protein n=1 Tax=uncultured Muriicola sp. TaxID=1583102 RepID=UPI0026053952|nr:adenylate/guanylate cyclase domain-containing protein [uncultured Muriicola sp.]